MKNDHICLAEDIDYLIVEKEESPHEQILKLDHSSKPVKINDKYRVRIKFSKD